MDVSENRILKIPIAHKYPETGEGLASYPADINILDCAKAVCHDMPGWNRPTTDARTYYELANQHKS
ncbi:hypothetical protein S7711_02833 [Stachybotrys chartarum IBT 7711]|uniref:Uncharacterized protein n=1 Tax=Stachybotrys chartarum (strain CBS 109288 / IBT 7711) TaxID=1280523 RepID=A0A084AH50_STACB|nr:hypothetical protein S7711_02833 [Stachybotrys chartarum IBT 7711]KFA56269.1 hypothetical protein S40293_00126 [Stachybotrys chartarum IBT 40293]